MQVMPDRRGHMIRTGLAMGPVSLTVELSDPGDAGADIATSTLGVGKSSQQRQRLSGQ